MSLAPSHVYISPKFGFLLREYGQDKADDDAQIAWELHSSSHSNARKDKHQQPQPHPSCLGHVTFISMLPLMTSNFLLFSLNSLSSPPAWSAGSATYKLGACTLCDHAYRERATSLGPAPGQSQRHK